MSKLSQYRSRSLMEAFSLPYPGHISGPSSCLVPFSSSTTRPWNECPSLLCFPNTAVCDTVFPDLPFHTTPADQLIGPLPFKALREMPTLATRTQCRGSTRVQISALPLTSCMPLDKWLKLPVPQFPGPSTRIGDDSIYLIGLI